MVKRTCLTVAALTLIVAALLLTGCNDGGAGAADARTGETTDAAILATSEVEKILKRKVSKMDCSLNQTRTGWGAVRISPCFITFADEDQRQVTAVLFSGIFADPARPPHLSVACSILTEGQPVSGVGDWAGWYTLPSPPDKPLFGTLYARQGDDLVCVSLYFDTDRERVSRDAAKALVERILARR